MSKRIRVNGVLYEAIGGDWLDNLPRNIGNWEWDGDDFAIFQKFDMSSIEVTITYGDYGEDVLTADVYLDGDYPQQISRTVSVKVPEGGITEAVRTILDALEPVIDRYGYVIENMVDEKAEELDGDTDYAIGELLDDDDDFNDAIDKIRPKLNSALQKAVRKLG